MALANFAIAEKAGLLPVGSERVIEFRRLRNSLTHEYIEDAQKLITHLNRAIEVSGVYIEMLDRLIAYSEEHLGLSIGNDLERKSVPMP